MFISSLRWFEIQKSWEDCWHTRKTLKAVSEISNVLTRLVCSRLLRGCCEVVARLLRGCASLVLGTSAPANLDCWLAVGRIDYQWSPDLENGNEQNSSTAMSCLANARCILFFLVHAFKSNSEKKTAWPNGWKTKSATYDENMNKMKILACEKYNRRENGSTSEREKISKIEETSFRT